MVLALSELLPYPLALLSESNLRRQLRLKLSYELV